MGYLLGKRNLHINFPGGVPVDGPSAGAAMALAAISAITSNTYLVLNMNLSGLKTFKDKTFSLFL